MVECSFAASFAHELPTHQEKRVFDPNNPSDVPTSKTPTDVLEWLQKMRIVAPPSPAEVMRQHFQTAHEKDLIIIEQLEHAARALRERGEQAPSPSRCGTEN